VTLTAEEIHVGDVVRNEHMATDAGGEELKDCEVTDSYRTTLDGWAIEWRMVADETVTGTLLTRPSVAVEVVSRASGGGL
jgi:hypothetical protein